MTRSVWDSGSGHGDNCCVEGDVVRAVVLGVHVFGCCVENCCVEGHSVGGCGVGGKLLVVSFGGLSGYYCGSIGLCSLGTGNVGAMCRDTTRILSVVWNCEITRVMEDGEKAEGLIRVKRT